MRVREEDTRKGGMPMSRSRATVDGQSLVCSVVSTRWPVRAARMPICAVSRSRVSPTRMTSGSWRRKARSALANVRPISSLIWTWLTPRRLYSTGSSAVLGQAALGDVEAGHDLHARGESGLQALGRRHDLVQHAIDAEADAEDLLVWLEVDVGGAASDGVHEDHVDEPDHRRLVGRFLEVEVDDLARRPLLVPLDHLDVRGRALHLRHDVGDAPALAVIRSIDGLPDRCLRGHCGPHLKVRHEAHI